MLSPLGSGGGGGTGVRGGRGEDSGGSKNGGGKEERKETINGRLGAGKFHPHSWRGSPCDKCSSIGMDWLGWLLPGCGEGLSLGLGLVN